MDLNSGRVITQRKVTEVPVTKLVIKAVEQMAYNKGFKSLKFKNRHGVIFHETDWITGVDYGFKSLKFKNRRGVIFHETDWITGVDYDRNDLEIGTGESDEESEPYEPEYLAGVPEDNEMDAEEIDPDEIDDILHDVESNPNEYHGQDQEELETNEPDYLAGESEEDTSVDPVKQELHEEQEEPNKGQEYEETVQREDKDSQQPNVRRSTRTTRPVGPDYKR